MKRIASLILITATLPFIGYGKSWSISNQFLVVRFNDRTMALTVEDKRLHKTWNQLLLQKGQQLLNVSGSNSSFHLKVKDGTEFSAEITLGSGPEVTFSLKADPAQRIGEINFPSAWETPNKENYILSTDGGGYLLAADDAGYPVGKGQTYFCGGGLSMAWMGITDKKFKAGYMAIVETPYDAALTTFRSNGLISFKPVWLPSMGKIGYERRIRYVFFDKGGYVAQCKTYRAYIWKKNNIITLKARREKIPSIEKMVGAVHIYVWDNARTGKFAGELKTAGIDNAFLLWNPNHLPYPERGYDDSLKNLGYASGVYELFTDIHIRDTGYYASGATYLSRTYFPNRYKSLVSRKEDGSVYSNHFGTYINPASVRPEIIKRVDKEMGIYPHEGYFFDVWQANGLYESWGGKILTRQEYAEAIIENLKMMEDKYHVFSGGEWGADFANQYSIFNHGMMTLQRTWFGSDVNKKGTIYYGGDWKNPTRPTQVLNSRVAPDTYLEYSINEYTRVPLYDLVYHDAVVSSWRWEDGNQHEPEIWWKKDLFNILYGTAPLWCLDKEIWEDYRITFLQSYQKICPWLKQIGYEELVNHRFLTTDHSVQESTFSSGKKVIVNFSNHSYLFGKNMIAAKGYFLY